MNLCKPCLHVGLCVVRQQLEKSTVLEFPDGKVALVDMEDALKSCDHFLAGSPQAVEVPEPVPGAPVVPVGVRVPPVRPQVRAPEPQAPGFPDVEDITDSVPPSGVQDDPVGIVIPQDFEPSQGVRHQDRGVPSSLGTRRRIIRLGNLAGTQSQTR